MNWKRLSAALDFYARRGYTRIEVPWVVSTAASDATKPVGGNNLVVNPTCGDPAWGVLVASAEQSFIELIYDGKLAPGKYVTLTPCWRREDKYSEAVCPWFMKVELINFGQADSASTTGLLCDAETFMDRYCESRTAIIDTDEGYDLFLNGYEVGSYGIRTERFWDWTYGTGLAEPRFEVALNAGT